MALVPNKAMLLSASSHPTWQYPPGTVRWRRLKIDDAKHAPGWQRKAVLLQSHPITGEDFPDGKRQWWMRETKI